MCVLVGVCVRVCVCVCVLYIEYESFRSFVSKLMYLNIITLNFIYLVLFI